jgi:alpha-ribazole phosphatase
MTELLLIRHGETDWNVEGRYQGQSDVPLNDRGHAQAAKLAAQLKGTQIDAIYSSDLERAKGTAEILAEVINAPVVLDPRLREIHQGLWEGMLFQDIQGKYAEAFERRKQDPLTVAPPEGETVGQLRSRILAALRDVLQKHPDGRVAIVSHGLSLALIRVELMDIPIQQVWDHIPPNAEPEIVAAEGL